MKQKLNEMYLYPLPRRFKEHLRNDLGFNEYDKKIIDSLSTHSGDSNFHYDNTCIPKDKFEYRLGRINDRIFEELIRLAKVGFEKESTSEPQHFTS